MENNAPAPSTPSVDGIQAAPEAPQAAPDTGVQNDAVDTEEQEWEDARKEAFPDVKEGDEDGEAKPKEPGEEGGEGEGQEEGEDGEEDQSQGAPGEDNSAARDARRAAREYTKQVEEVKSDVRSKMFGDVPDEVRDADGDPITSVEDVMTRINPDTGEPFERQEAQLWLQTAQSQLAKVQQDADKRASEVAEVNVELKDQADSVNERYGKFLQNPDNHELRDKLWASFEKTLRKDEKTGIITEMSVSLEEFYDIALGGRVEQPKVDGMQPQPTPQEQAQAEAKAAAEAAAQKQKARADRSDIYAPSTAPIVDDEDKEWGEAAKGYYGERINK